MKNIIFFFLIFLIGFASAQFTISPDKINITSYAGETHEVQFYIITDGNYALFFNSTNPYITLSPRSIIVEKELNMTLNITFSKDIPAGNYNFNIISFTEAVEVQIPSDSGGSSGSSGGSYCGSAKTKIINNTIYVENATCEDNQQTITGEVISETEKIKINERIYWLIGIFVLCGVLYSIILIKKRKNTDVRRYKNGKRI